MKDPFGHELLVSEKSYGSIEGTADGKPRKFKSRWRRLERMMFPSGIWKSWVAIMRLVGPIMVTQMMQMTLTPVAAIFCGHIGDKHEFDGAALALSLINVSVVSVAQGLGTSCDTFFSRSFSGKNKKMVGEYLQKAIFVFMMACIPFLTIHLNTSFILKSVGYDHQVADYAGEYLFLFMPGALSFFIYIILCKYVQNQKIVVANMVISIAANVINAVCQYIFIFKCNWGVAGSSLAMMLSFVFLTIATLSYILVTRCYVDTWNGWSRRAFVDWGLFAHAAFSGMFMMCSEWWAFEIGVFAAGLLGTTELGAQAVLLHIDTWWFTVPLGFQIASTIRIGHCLGANDPESAVTTHRLTVLTLAILALIPVFVFNVFKHQLPYIITNIDEIAEKVSTLFYIVTIYIVLDGVSLGYKASLYATGRQKVGAALVFVGYYVLCLPIGLTLMFKVGLGTAGYWWGISMCICFQCCFLCVIVGRFDWKEECKKAELNKDIQLQYEDQTDKTKVSYRSSYIKRIVAASILLLVLTGGIILRIYTRSI